MHSLLGFPLAVGLAARLGARLLLLFAAELVAPGLGPLVVAAVIATRTATVVASLLVPVVARVAIIPGIAISTLRITITALLVAISALLVPVTTLGVAATLLVLVASAILVPAAVLVISATSRSPAVIHALARHLAKRLRVLAPRLLSWLAATTARVASPAAIVTTSGLTRLFFDHSGIGNRVKESS